MAVIVTSIGLRGIEGYKVSVEVELLDGVESMTIVGLPGAAVKESRERVLAALKGFDCDFADRKVIVYLSPAEERKIGPLFDVAIAVAMLKSNGHLKSNIPKDIAFLGSLSLDGTIHAVRGMLPAVISAKKLGIRKLFLPHDSALPIEKLDGIELIYAEHLTEVVDHLSDQPVLPLHPRERPSSNQSSYFEGKDFQHIIGHQQAKRALEIAAAGCHNVLMSGPPGCGKSLLAESFPSILPPLLPELQFENMSLYELSDAQIASYCQPPFRHPHHFAEARERQFKRYGKTLFNGNVPIDQLFSKVQLTGSQQTMMQTRAMKVNWSNRVQVKMIRLARTITDLRGEENISDEAVWEAMTLRRSFFNQVTKQKGSSLHGS